MSDAEVGTEVDIEDYHVDVVGGIPALPISEFESEGFTFPKIVQRKDLER